MSINRHLALFQFSADNTYKSGLLLQIKQPGKLVLQFQNLKGNGPVAFTVQKSADPTPDLAEGSSDFAALTAAANLNVVTAFTVVANAERTIEINVGAGTTYLRIKATGNTRAIVQIGGSATYQWIKRGEAV